MLVLTPDIPECVANPCDANAMCTEFLGSFSCACNSGFSGDGFTCVGKLLHKLSASKNIDPSVFYTENETKILNTDSDPKKN